MSSRDNTPGILLAVSGLIDLLMIGVGLGFLLLGGAAAVAMLGWMSQQSGMGGLNNSQMGLQLAMSGIQILIGAVVDVLGLLAAAFVLLGGARSIQGQSPGVVRLAAITSILLPLGMVFGGYFGGCGMCGCIGWIPLAVLGVAAGVITLTRVDESGGFEGEPPTF